MEHDPTLYKSRPHPNRDHLHLRIAPAEITAARHRRPKGKPPRRSEITSWSEDSRRRLKWTLRNTVGKWFTMITLTYQTPPEPRQAKQHLNAFLQGLRRRGLEYLWVLELQERGAIHFHIYTSAEWLPIADLRASWTNISGAPAQAINVSPVRRPFYIIKYATKSEGNDGSLGRYWGTNCRVPTEKLVIPEALHRVLRKYAERHLPDQPPNTTYLPCSVLSPATLNRLLVYYGLASPEQESPPEPLPEEDRSGSGTPDMKEPC